ncbi:hypothetical protein OIU76_019445 [Salix suchowensis]|uniref:Uncharacterized protein n=1 Tax=Salix suchowensis TaxID=1278906 RepID=A0ABQ8ZIN4_9ROSI|nr:inner centromere protein [Salix suchowensis]KAJ6298296.1 hypothetical protein OIU76_019445 [Salix suchowensis]KAJ6301720.1 hypothetical protein OIU77_015936 [Salix suchowensis]
MDLKSKGMAWAGNIYQKFETMCHEVDNVVNKDTFKFVENQVYSVGENMKKIYSVAVHDLIPPLVDPAKCEAPAADQKISAIVGAYSIKSMTCTEDDHGYTSQEKQSPVELGDYDPMTKQLGKDVWELQVANQLTSTSNSEEIHEGAESESALGVDDVTTETSDLSTEENAIKENSCGPEELESITHGNKEPFEASSEFPDFSSENACGFLAEVSPVTLVPGEEFQCPKDVGTACDSCAGDSYSANGIVSSSQMSFSVVSSEKEAVEMKIASPRCSIFRESHCFPGNPLNNITTKLTSCSNPCNVVGHDSDCSKMLLSSTSSLSDSSVVLLSSTSAPTFSCKINGAETGFDSSSSVLSLVSIGYSDDSAIEDLTGSEMENIDLSENAKLDESCVIVDNSFLYEVSRRNHRLRSCKKKIQDAFSSKKRLTKEYEQLAIWFGDIDGHDTMQHELPSSTTITLDPDPQTQTNWRQDSEWELL